MKLSLVQPKSSHKPYLYWVVFDTVLVKSMITFLFVFFLFSPAEAAFAADEEAADTLVEESVVVEEPEPEPEPEVVEATEENQGDLEPEPEETETESEPSAQPEVEESAETEGSDAVATTEPTDSDEVVVPEEVTETAETTTENTPDETEVDTPQTEQTDTDAEESAEGDTGSSSAGGGTTDEDNNTSTVSETPVEDDVSAGGGLGTTEETTATTMTDSSVLATSTATSTAAGEPGAEENAETNSTTTESVAESNVDETEVSPSETDPEAGDVAVTPEEVVDVSSTDASDNASSTAEVIYIMTDNVSDSNLYSFTDDQCASVGDGSYYCSKDTVIEGVLEDGVYAEQDESGDHEIYLREDGVVTQLTDNQYEDRSPYLDSLSQTVVFHRLVNGRYQIFEVNKDGDNERQLTTEHTNHMEPTRADDVTVWQEWVDVDWEIVALINGERTQLTDNDRHDVAPMIQDGFIMWHVTNSGGDKLLSVYEIETGITSDIADPDGGQVENPRFVLVYDTKFENGDLITKTYDPETGEVRPVGSEPAPLPTLPDPEPTGEESAIIQNKSSNKSEAEEEVDNLISNFKAGTASSSPVSDDSDEVESGATSTSEMVEESVELAADVDMSEAATTTLPLTEFDLIVEPYEATSSAQSTDSASSSDSVE